MTSVDYLSTKYFSTAFVSSRREIPASKDFSLYVLEIGIGGEHVLSRKKRAQGTPYFKVLKELFMCVFEENRSQCYKLQYLLVVSVNPFTNKRTRTHHIKSIGASRYQHLSLTFVSKLSD